MVRKVTVAVGFLIALLAAQPAVAVPVAPTDFDGFPLGALHTGPVNDVFTVALPPPPTMGTIESNVFFDGTNYTYVHTVTPTTNSNFLFNTEFQANGFTGVAGWSFSDALLASGSGDANDFQIQQLSGQLNWTPTLGGSFGGWESGEAITFFFVSTRPPSIGDYNLLSTEAGSAQTLAPSPVPEPGSIALLGSGLMGLYAAMRRRRTLER